MTVNDEEPDEPRYAAFAADLKALRLQAGLTLVECAMRSGMSEKNLRLLEKGNQRPHPPTVAQLAKAVGVTEERMNRTLVAVAPDEMFSEPELKRLAELIAPLLAQELRCLLQAPQPKRR